MAPTVSSETLVRTRASSPWAAAAVVVVPPIPIPTVGAEPPSSAHYANGAANRAPHRPPSVVSKSSGGAAVSDSSVTAAAWSIGGSPARAPAWASALLSLMAKEGLSVQDVLAVTEDPWQVLVGWVPSRFMGPQKIGKKANGDPMIPPTKGRDIEVYLKDYNASWHGAFENGGFAYHFQLLHRNSLAVCIRERLHIHALHLYPSPAPTRELRASGWDRPLVVYHCPCRHCNEHTASIPEGQPRLSDAFPEYASPFLTAGGAVNKPVHPPQPPFLPLEGSLYQAPDTSDPKALDAIPCLGALSAPWLMTTAAVPAFPYEGLYDDLDALLKAQADVNGVVMMVMFNKFWIDHLHNFIFSIVHRAKFSHFIVATIDAETLGICIQARLPCYNAISHAEFEEDMAAGGGGEVKGATRKVTEAMSWIKPRLALAVLERGYHFIMSDLDMSFNFNPMKELVSIGFDIAHQCDAKDKFSINSGFYLARSNPRTIRFFHNLMLFTPQENSDQTAMKLFARYDHTHGASNGCLDRRHFNMKCYYKVGGSVRVEQGVETFEWHPFNSDRSTFTWRMHHATCLNGAMPKVVYLRTIGAWFLDDLDRYTTEAHDAEAQKGGGYCVLGLDGTTRHYQSRSITTQHSAKYTKDTSAVYLQKRH